ncbi:unnamed protein product [Prorocentrum cordatum]|uniref:Amino acid transporter transmembrane domain-containing protein n=1 Tax=Prorocentrum cordatum TaxID=2364126 RepID=A0ABN9UE41_9DINO|nr:unnamed protein product [Polarella glacialis]
MSTGGLAGGLGGVGGRPLVQAAEVRDAASSAASDADADARDTEGFEEAKQRASTPGKRLGYASAFSGAAVLANTLLGGSGMLGIPHALARSGWLLGCVLVVLFGCASAFGSHLLHCSARRIGHAPCTFYTVCREAAPRWTWLIDGAVMVKCFGVGTSYLIIVGDLAPPALEFLLGGSWIRRWHTVTVGFAAAGALSCLPDLTPLRYTATASVLITFWVVVLILLFYCRAGPAFEPCGSPGEGLPCCPAGGTCPAPVAFSAIAPHGFVELGRALPVFIFGFTCQQNVFTICNEVRVASKRRMDNIVLSAYTVSGFAFAFAALFGYATYGDGVTSDVLRGYPQDTVVQVTRLLFSLLAVFSYPLQAHPSRTSCLSLWALACDSLGTAGREIGQEGGGAGRGGAGLRERQRFRVATVVGLSSSYLIAVVVQDLSAVLGVVGATGSTMVSYILPGLCYTQTFRDPHIQAQARLASARRGLRDHAHVPRPGVLQVAPATPAAPAASALASHCWGDGPAADRPPSPPPPPPPPPPPSLPPSLPPPSLPSRAPCRQPCFQVGVPAAEERGPAHARCTECGLCRGTLRAAAGRPAPALERKQRVCPQCPAARSSFG